MHEEIQSLEKNNIWQLEPLLLDRKCVDCEWVHKVKYKADGTST